MRAASSRAPLCQIPFTRIRIHVFLNPQLFLPDSPLVHTYPAKLHANPQLLESALQSGNFWIRKQFETVWTRKSGYSWIRWRGKVRSSLYRVNIQHGRRTNIVASPTCNFFKPDSVCVWVNLVMFTVHFSPITNDDSIFWGCYRNERVCLSFIISLRFLSRMWHTQLIVIRERIYSDKKNPNMPPSLHITIDALLCACSIFTIFTEEYWALQWIRIPARYVWTGEFYSKTLRVDANFFKSATENMRIQIYPDTCGRGLS